MAVHDGPVAQPVGQAMDQIPDAGQLANMFLQFMLAEIGCDFQGQWKRLGLRETCLPEEVSWVKKQLGAQLHPDKNEGCIIQFMEVKALSYSPEVCSN